MAGLQIQGDESRGVVTHQLVLEDMIGAALRRGATMHVDFRNFIADED